jgi:hypothetical protein
MQAARKLVAFQNKILIVQSSLHAVKKVGLSLECVDWWSLKFSPHFEIVITCPVGRRRQASDNLCSLAGSDCAIHGTSVYLVHIYSTAFSLSVSWDIKL